MEQNVVVLKDKGGRIRGSIPWEGAGPVLSGGNKRALGDAEGSASKKQVGPSGSGRGSRREEGATHLEKT